MQACKRLALVAGRVHVAITFNEQETARFGVRCARVIDPSVPTDVINAEARKHAITFLSARVSTHDTRIVHALEDDGYRLMDTLVYYERAAAASGNEPAVNSDIHVRSASLRDAEDVGSVAGAAFAGYFGHFHADERLSDADCDAVYVDWAKNCVVSQSSSLPVLVACAGDSVVGFLAATRVSDTCADIALNAVSPKMQGRGVYHALLVAALDQIADAGIANATISTQVNNTAVQSVWCKLGFRMQRSLYTLHKWMDEKAERL